MLRDAKTLGAIVVGLLPLAAVACDDAVHVGQAEGAQLSIEVAPLSLDGVADAAYTLTVYNGPDRSGEVVWSRSSLASSRFGDGRGSLSYVGPCDASTPVGSVELELIDLFESPGVPIDRATYQNPTPIVRDVVCAENADVSVVFDMTIARDAQQGFFDVAVDLDDVFCSAKLDCVDDETGADLELLFQDGARALTAVMGFACTASPTGASTNLYVDDPIISCVGLADNVTFDISTRGNVDFAAAGNDNPGDYLFGAAVYRGTEALAQKAYWNVAFGLGDATLECTLHARATATTDVLAAGVEGFELPAGVVYPVIEWEVPLTDANGRVCGAHAVNQGAEVAVKYHGYLPSLNQFTWRPGPTAFRHRFDTGDDTVESFVAAPLAAICAADESVDGFASGSGTVEDPYVVCDAAQLQRVQGDAAAHYVQGTDVDLAGASWAPLPELTGSYDGHGNGIYGLSMDLPAVTGVGLFVGIGGDGELRDVHVRSGSVVGKSNVGALAGVMSGAARLVGCSNAASVVASDGDAGGLVGAADAGTLANLRNEGAVSGTHYTGGIAATIGFGATGADLHNLGAVTGSGSRTGGIAAHSGGPLVRVRNSGDVTADNADVYAMVGGVAGILFSDVDVALNEGTVTAHQTLNAKLGGLTANVSSAYAQVISNVLNTGRITATGAGTPHSACGGIVAESVDGQDAIRFVVNLGQLDDTEVGISFIGRLGGVLGRYNDVPELTKAYSVAIVASSAPNSVGDDVEVSDWAPVIGHVEFDPDVWSLDAGGVPVLDAFAPQ